jgi:hypothetical protein
MRTRRPLYWALAGSLMGFGFIGILSIGSPFLLLGLGLVIFGLIRHWFGGFWAFLIGFGGLPALILIFDIVTAPPQCPPGHIVLPPGVHFYECGGPLDNYRMLAIIFGAIALVGVAWPLIQRFWHGTHGAGG